MSVREGLPKFPQHAGCRFVQLEIFLYLLNIIAAGSVPVVLEKGFDYLLAERLVPFPDFYKWEQKSRNAL